jgi:hypothetical protein
MLVKDGIIIIEFYVKNGSELQIIKDICNDDTMKLVNTKHPRYGEFCTYLILNKITNINLSELDESYYL